MKKHKILSIIMTFILLFLSGCQSNAVKNVHTQKQFDDLLEKEFISTMEQDYVSAHIYLENASAYQVDTSKIDVNLGAGFQIEDRELARKEVDAFLDELSDIDYQELREEQQHLYMTLIEQTMIEQDLLKEMYDYYDQAFSSMNGIHYQLPTLFSDWILKDEQDVKDLILLVQDVKPYIEEALTYTKIQADKGLLMTNIEDVVSYCETILSHKEDSAILDSLYDSIDMLSLKEELKTEYKKQLKEAFDTYFYPSYEQIVLTLNQLSNKNNKEGLFKFEHGKSYYELLIQKDLGSLTSIDSVSDLLEEELTNHIVSINDKMSNENVKKVLETGEFPDTSYHSYEAILEDIQMKMKKDFPEIKDVSYEIYDVNKQLASTSGVVAYFNVPSLDATTPKQMRVNPNSADINSLSTYITVAHEGFPGHMYQYAYMYENISSNFHKTLVNVPAYVEGYAVYAQYKSLDYIDGIYKDILSLYKDNEIISYCVSLLSDIGIHYKGWSLSEYQQFMESMGYNVEDKEIVKLQYNQLQANPAAFVPYYVGYLEFEKIREDAQEKLKDDFDEKEFHTAILSSGIANFDVVETCVEQNYIEKKK